ncbi:MAG: hypothetical protein ACM336_04430 [Acidobacteriota bacterium]
MISAGDERAELQRILDSRQFRRAPKLQKLLTLVCEYYFAGRATEINEFLIAGEAFDRRTDFDPSQDSIVRVQAREARRRLREYYQGEGRRSRLVLDIPIGSYIPTFTPVHPARSAFSFPALWPKLAVAVLAAIGVLLVLAFRGSASNGSSATAKAGGLHPTAAQLWNRFLNSDAPTVVVLSNPSVSDCTEEEIAASGQESCPDEYTGMGEAEALHLITGIFSSGKSRLTVKQSRALSAEEARRSNLILLGGQLVNSWTRALGPDLALGGGNDDPPLKLSRTESESYRTVFDRRTGTLVRDRGLMALRRHPTSGHWLLFLYGAHSQGTHAVAEAAVDPLFLSQLKWPGQPFPDRFEIFVGAQLSGGVPAELKPVALRIH